MMGRALLAGLSGAMLLGAAPPQALPAPVDPQFQGLWFPEEKGDFDTFGAVRIGPDSLTLAKGGQIALKRQGSDIAMLRLPPRAAARLRGLCPKVPAPALPNGLAIAPGDTAIAGSPARHIIITFQHHAPGKGSSAPAPCYQLYLVS